MAQCVEDSGSGESIEEAVKVEATDDYTDRHIAEYGYISRIFGKMFDDWVLKRQSLLQAGERKYDLIEFMLKNGTPKKLYFEVTGVVEKEK